MTLHDTEALPVEVSTPYARIVVHYAGKEISVSGAMPQSKARRRLELLRNVNRDQDYALVETTKPPPPTITTRTHRRRHTR
jgi:hypothetical protein